MTTDEELLRGYADGHSQAAFAELVERHVGLVFHAALRRTNQDTPMAEEVTQVVFTALAREAGKLGRHTALTGWLYVATRHAAAKAMRAETRRRRREEALSVMQPTKEMEDGEVEWSRVKTVLDEMMDELGARDREAVLLRFFEGRAFGEIGAALRVSEDAARVRVNRALEKLRGLLVKRGVTSTAAALGGLLAGNAAMAAPAGLAANVTGAALTAGSVAVVAVAGATAGVAGGVGVQGGVGGGILTFMTTTKLVTGVACVVAAVAVGTAVWQAGEARRARAELGVQAQRETWAQRRADQLTKELATAERGKQEAERVTTSLQSKLDEALAAAKAADGNAVLTSARLGIDLMNVLYEDAGFQDATLQKFLASVKFKYAPFYRRMGMSVAQIDRFEKALLVREQAQIDQNAAARSQMMSVSDPSLGKVVNPGFAEAYTELRGALGEEGLKKFEAYENAVGSEGETKSLLASSLYSDTPLTLEQSERFAELLAANRVSEMNGSIRTYTGYNWDEIRAKAAAILPEAQAAFVRSYVEKAKAEQRWGEYWRAAQIGKPLSEVTRKK